VGHADMVARRREAGNRFQWEVWPPEGLSERLLVPSE